MSKEVLHEYAYCAHDFDEILFSSEEISARVADLGRMISDDYRHLVTMTEPLVLIGVLKGVVIFLADLLRAIEIPVEIQFLDIDTYSADIRESSLVELADMGIATTIRNRHVLVIEDVVDAGLSLNLMLRLLSRESLHSIEVCTMFSKEANRLIDVSMKYVGFELPDLFVVGYGLDYKERYRGLPFLATLKPELMS